MTGGHRSEVFLVIILLGRDLGWSLLIGDGYSEVVVSTSMYAFIIQPIFYELTKKKYIENRQLNAVANFDQS